MNDEVEEENETAEKLPITTKKPILKINLFSKLNKSIDKDKPSNNNKRVRSDSASDYEANDKNTNVNPTKKYNKSLYLPEFPNIEVIKIDLDDDCESTTFDDLNLRYVLFKDRLVLSKTAFQ